MNKKEYIKNKLIKIEEKKTIAGSRKRKHLQKYSNKFNEIFDFFLKSYRSNLLTFCGSNVNVKFNINAVDAKLGFRMFENGEMKLYNLESSQPNILKAVIIAKKALGLTIDEFSDGIVDFSFTKEELLYQFKENNITIPNSFLIDFENAILKKKIKRNDIELDRLKQKNII